MATKSTEPPRCSIVDDEFARVRSVLGYSPCLRSPIEVHELIFEGLPRTTVLYMVGNMHEIKFDECMLALNISSRTWHRMKANASERSKPLDVDQSARVWKMAEILAKGEEVLGTREEAEQWLTRQAIGLDSRRPIDLMTTPQGADLVKTLLEQMEYGVYA